MFQEHTKRVKNIVSNPPSTLFFEGGKYNFQKLGREINFVGNNLGGKSNGEGRENAKVVWRKGFFDFYLLTISYHGNWHCF